MDGVTSVAYIVCFTANKCLTITVFCVLLQWRKVWNIYFSIAVLQWNVDSF